MTLRGTHTSKGAVISRHPVLQHRATRAKDSKAMLPEPCTILDLDPGFPQPIGTPQLTWSSALRFGIKRCGDDRHPRAIERCLRPRHLPHQQRIGAMLLASASSMRQSWVRAHARRRGRVPGVLQGA